MFYKIMVLILILLCIVSYIEYKKDIKFIKVSGKLLNDFIDSLR
jgi:hypothetical protein